MGRKGYYFYNDTDERSVFTGFGFKSDPNKVYVRHYGNWLELNFYAKNTSGLDQFQAEKELKICEEKLERTAKRPGFELGMVMLDIQRLKRMWEVSEVPDRWSK